MRIYRLCSMLVHALGAFILAVCAASSWALEKVVDPINVTAFEAQLAESRSINVPVTSGVTRVAATGANIAKDYASMLKDVNSRMPGIACPRSWCK